ncbi:hypothetical protein BO70DRAFT_224954 [Aspergillus heteromorphus CBS 117.55]|uniref:Uncharacterized protein n=1 Tax=Aspergillus heteromorphus CBS 117.55 TaxID=1448321 RepID=A0A317WPX2_9EURO|nr:uncharacterized protein BO70DRAFT_224954 [Aspergillus heteromorphus CBS 117.55]PWY86280.1 hypothetical protein BO70DRAFT_224954 [Aspergillus heteromorphus CBS 117.55]
MLMLDQQCLGVIGVVIGGTPRQFLLPTFISFCLNAGLVVTACTALGGMASIKVHATRPSHSGQYYHQARIYSRRLRDPLAISIIEEHTQ